MVAVEAVVAAVVAAGDAAEVEVAAVVAAGVVPPLLLVAVDADAVVGVDLFELPHAARSAAMAGALSPIAAARFRTWRRVRTPEMASR